MKGVVYRFGVKVQEFGSGVRVGFIFRLGNTIKDFGASALI